VGILASFNNIIGGIGVDRVQGHRWVIFMVGQLKIYHPHLLLTCFQLDLCIQVLKTFRIGLLTFHCMPPTTPPWQSLSTLPFGSAAKITAGPEPYLIWSRISGDIPRRVNWTSNSQVRNAFLEVRINLSSGEAIFMISGPRCHWDSYPFSAGYPGGC